MKAVIFDGFLTRNPKNDNLRKLIVKLLEKHEFEVEYVILADTKIAPCQGCMRCWFNTPGLCRIDDYGRKTAQMVRTKDLMVYISPITFGGFSSELKKMLDSPNIEMELIVDLAYEKAFKKYMEHICPQVL